MTISKDSLGKMTDTKWHIGYVSMSPGDTRRDRRKCINFRRKTKTCLYGIPCQGSSHCINYKERKKPDSDVVTSRKVSVYLLGVKPHSSGKKKKRRSNKRLDYIPLKMPDGSTIP